MHEHIAQCFVGRGKMEEAALLSLLLVTGGFAGLSSGLFGVGGGFVVVPALLFVFDALGYQADGTILVAVATSLATIVFASIRASFAHFKMGSFNVDFVRDWLPWVSLGTFAGVLSTSFMPVSNLTVIFAVGVAFYSLFFLFPSLFTHRTFEKLPSGSIRALMGTSVGTFSALLGIGGGTPVVITMVVCGRPASESVGTAAGIGCIIGILGAFSFLFSGLFYPQSNLPPGTIGFVNLPALLVISLVSIFTAPMGARLAHRLNSQVLKRCFGAYLLCVSSTILFKYF